jgi:hypothetical protein
MPVPSPNPRNLHKIVIRMMKNTDYFSEGRGERKIRGSIYAINH